MSDVDLALMRRLDELHLEHPFMGARMQRDQLWRKGTRSTSAKYPPIRVRDATPPFL